MITHNNCLDLSSLPFLQVHQLTCFELNFIYLLVCNSDLQHHLTSFIWAVVSGRETNHVCKIHEWTFMINVLNFEKNNARGFNFFVSNGYQMT